jgi:hypothetical protein
MHVDCNVDCSASYNDPKRREEGRFFTCWHYQRYEAFLLGSVWQNHGVYGMDNAIGGFDVRHDDVRFAT